MCQEAQEAHRLTVLNTVLAYAKATVRYMSALVGIAFIMYRMSLGRKIHHPTILTRDMYEYASHIHRKCTAVGWYNKLDSRLVRLSYNMTYNYDVSVSCIMYEV